ncbi:MAG: hypothetical protein P8L18_14785 [Verrucomicrobiota bacterium]|nr:hypothetical protein [Verrucomicrobiota bacterium]
MIRFLILFFAGGWFLQLSGEDLHEDVHWAFVPPLLPQMPEVRDTAWPRQPIDYFILMHLRNMGSSHPRGQTKRRSYDVCGSD